MNCYSRHLVFRNFPLKWEWDPCQLSVSEIYELEAQYLVVGKQSAMKDHILHPFLLSLENRIWSVVLFMFWLMWFNSCYLLFIVIDASHTFYTANTLVCDNGELHSRKYTKILCQCTDPEDKRRIIGDTFMNVSHSLMGSLY